MAGTVGLALRLARASLVVEVFDQRRAVVLLDEVDELRREVCTP